MEILTLIVVGLIIWNITLNNRIMDLENLFKNKNLIPAKTDTKPLKIAEKTITETMPTKTLVEKPAKLIRQKPAKEFHLEDFLGGKLFAILGVVSIVLAIGFFTTWAFNSGVVGPKGRVAIGILFSLIVLGIGEFLRPKYPKFFDKISAAGIAGLLITTYLARNYEFEGIDAKMLTGHQAFAAYAFEVIIGIFLALQYNARFLGSFSIFAGIVIPLLVNSDPNPVGLFSYLSVLAIAGFVISLWKKWPEVLAILLLGTIAYEVGIFDLESGKWQLISPIIYLSFVYGISFLLGSGGLIRTLREKTEQNFAKIKSLDYFESILSVSAIFAANLLGYAVFKDLNWEHFGFFILAQGFAFFFLSEFVKSRKLMIWHKIYLAATLVSVVFATIWEIGTDNELMLALFLIVESLLFSFAGKKTDEPLFSIFGKITAFFSLIGSTEINNFAFNSIATLGTIVAFAYSINPTKLKQWKFEKPWIYAAAIISSILVLFWSFDTFNDFLGYEGLNHPLFVVPVLWGLFLAYSYRKTNSYISNIFGAILIGIIALYGSTFIDWGDRSLKDILDNFGILVFLVIGIFATLYSFYLNSSVGKDLQKTFTIIALVASSVLVLIFGDGNLSEPLKTIFWIIWGAKLFAFGHIKSAKLFRHAGIAMFMLLIAKLYLSDVWHWDTMQRFVAFLGLGISLLGVSFIYSKKDSKK